MNETLLPEQVREIVQELRGADYHVVGQEFFDSRVARLNNAGWKLGIVSFSRKVTHGERGHMLMTPKNQWRNVAYFYNPEQSIKVWYWDNKAFTKAAAVSMAEQSPLPLGNYTTFTK